MIATTEKFNVNVEGRDLSIIGDLSIIVDHRHVTITRLVDSRGVVVTGGIAAGSPRDSDDPLMGEKVALGRLLKNLGITGSDGKKVLMNLQDQIKDHRVPPVEELFPTKLTSSLPTFRVGDVVDSIKWRHQGWKNMTIGSRIEDVNVKYTAVRPSDGVVGVFIPNDLILRKVGSRGTVETSSLPPSSPVVKSEPASSSVSSSPTHRFVVGDRIQRTSTRGWPDLRLVPAGTSGVIVEIKNNETISVEFNRVFMGPEPWYVNPDSIEPFTLKVGDKVYHSVHAQGVECIYEDMEVLEIRSDGYLYVQTELDGMIYFSPDEIDLVSNKSFNSNRSRK